jgi:hypothetical protein
MFNKANSIPGQPVDFDYADLTIKTEEERSDLTRDIAVPNQTPVMYDPVNWFTFDEKGYPNNCTITNGNLDLTVSPFFYQGSINSYQQMGLKTAVLYEDGGPRNRGHIEITKTWLKINSAVRKSGTNFAINNEVWREGAIELTLKPLSDSAILSGGIDGEKNPGGFFFPSRFNDDLVKIDKNEYLVNNIYDNGEGTVTTTYSLATDVNGNIAGFWPNPDGGVELTNDKAIPRIFNVDIKNGKIVITYEVLYGPTRKIITLTGNKNIIDGEWHHLIINRPSEETKNLNGRKFGENGALEIWIDGVLDNRTYEITSRDLLPTPYILFNDIRNVGVRYAPGQSTQAIGGEINVPSFDYLKYAETTNYKGYVRDYIFYQTFGLSEHEINLHHTYALLHDDEIGRIIRSADLESKAELVMPKISSNKPKVLKLYWNALINKEEKMLNGFELDDNYNVFSYSVSKNNLISSSETFNLNLAEEEKERIFFNNVKTAINENVFILRPGLVITAGGTQNHFDLNGIPEFKDITNPQPLFEEYIDFKAGGWFVNNLQYGGASLNKNDRILLFGQIHPNENGIYIYEGPNVAMRKDSSISAEEYKNGHVFVEEGKYSGKTFVQLENVIHTRKSKQTWREIDSESAITTINSYPIHTSYWTDDFGNPRFIDINKDIQEDFDIIVFMNYPEENKDILNSFASQSESYHKEKYQEFIKNIKSAVYSGKKLFVSSPGLAVDLGIVSDYELVSQLLDETGDAQSAAISPFESGEPAENYFNTHRNMKYQFCNPLLGVGNKETYIVSDFVTYSPNNVNSDYHIKYTYRQFGLLEGDEFYIPGLTTLPETLNDQLPGYRFNQKGTKDLAVFSSNQLLMGNCVTRLSNIIYDKDNAVNNPYDDYISSIAVNYGNGKMFVNCVENTYAFSRKDYNTGIIQQVEIGENSETVETAAWQYSTLRLSRKNLYDFSEITNVIGQTVPTSGGGGGIVQSQSHCSNGMIRNIINKDDLRYQSDLYPDANEEVFETKEIPVLSMTWLGLQWLAE